MDQIPEQEQMIFANRRAEVMKRCEYDYQSCHKISTATGLRTTVSSCALVLTETQSWVVAILSTSTKLLKIMIDQERGRMPTYLCCLQQADICRWALGLHEVVKGQRQSPFLLGKRLHLCLPVHPQQAAICRWPW